VTLFEVKGGIGVIDPLEGSIVISAGSLLNETNGWENQCSWNLFKWMTLLIWKLMCPVLIFRQVQPFQELIQRGCHEAIQILTYGCHATKPWCGS